MGRGWLEFQEKRAIRAFFEAKRAILERRSQIFEVEKGWPLCRRFQRAMGFGCLLIFETWLRIELRRRETATKRRFGEIKYALRNGDETNVFQKSEMRRANFLRVSLKKISPRQPLAAQDVLLSPNIHHALRTDSPPVFANHCCFSALASRHFKLFFH